MIYTLYVIFLLRGGLGKIWKYEFFNPTSYIKFYKAMSFGPGEGGGIVNTIGEYFFFIFTRIGSLFYKR